MLKSQGFRSNRVWKPFVAKVGDKLILNHGAFTDEGSNNNLLRFYESPGLIHWKYLYEIPIDAKLYRTNGRWDHMYMLPKNDQTPAAESWGYMVADPIDHGGFGMMDSPDSIHFTPIKAPRILSGFRIPTLEIGGIKKSAGNTIYWGAMAITTVSRATAYTLMSPIRRRDRFAWISKPIG